MAGDWLAERRAEAAADRILDAADQLFAVQDAATIGMNEIAKAAGCSRATVYRYYDSREALHTAYVHRETHRVFREMGDQISGIAGSRERLLEGIVASLRSVRESRALASWFASTQRPIGGEMAERSDVIQALAEGFLASLGVEHAKQPARWLVRVMISLLVFPGHDDADERAMLEEFVLPAVMPAGQPTSLK